MVKVKLKNIKFHKWSKLGNNKKDSNYDWNKLRDSIKKNGFDQTLFKNRIMVSKDDYCIDGNHRVFVLKELYGDDYEINVIKSWFNFKTTTVILLILLLIISPLLMLKSIVKGILTLFNRIWPRPK